MKKTAIGIAVLAILVIAVVGIMLLYGSTPAACAGCSGSVLGLSQVNVQTANNATFTGRYWLATLLLNNYGQGLYYSKSLTAQSLASSSLNSSYTGTSQSDSITFTTLKNQVNYTANGNAGATLLYIYQLQQYTGSFSYTACNGGMYTVTGNQQTVPDGCFGGSGASAGRASYISACQTAVKATNSSNVGIPIVAGGNGFGGNNYICMQITRTLWGSVYQLIATTYQQVQLSLGGLFPITLTVSTSNPYQTHTNSTGKVDVALSLLGYGNGGVPIPNPPAFAIFVNNTSTKMIQATSVPNIQNAQTTAYNQEQGTISNATAWAQSASQGPTGQNTQSWIQGQLASADSAQVNTAYYYPTSPTVPNGDTIAVQNITSATGARSFLVVLNDPAGSYIVPQLQILAGFAQMGLSLAQANCRIVSYPSNVTFASGSSVTFPIAVQNTASVQGACRTSVTSIGTGFTVQPQNPQTINAGGTATFNFTLSNLIPTNQTQYSQATFTACDTVTGTFCPTSVTVQIKELPKCSTNYVLVNGTCGKIGQVTVPTTTTVPQGGGSNVTTTIPPITCRPLSVFNQTLYNQHINPPCWVPSVPPPIPMYVWIIIGLVVVLVIILVVVLTRGGRRRRR